MDFNSQKIIYDSDENPSGISIKVWERTTSNFSQSENFVVLECVDSLLEKAILGSVSDCCNQSFNSIFTKLHRCPSPLFIQIKYIIVIPNFPIHRAKILLFWSVWIAC